MNQYPLAERKLIYRVLHSQLAEFPDLMDGEFLLDLQRSLQTIAQAEGIDVADHGAWDEWLGNVPTACDVRMAGRREL
ncbi:MAG: hypothetical protein ACJ8C4_11370 [Gemmataceae bacterium]